MILFWRQAVAIAASLLCLSACLAAQTPASAAPPAAVKVAHSGVHRHAAPKAPPTPEPQPPPAPLTPEQMPPVPPQVTYSNGLLTIVTTNSTLADILQAVSARTGASVDAPAHLTSERVAARIGPGTPREVLSDLLSGPRFDYILVGSDGDPNGVRNIILTPNQSSPSASAAMAQVQPRPAPPAQEEMDEEVEEEQAAQPEPQPAQSPRRRPFAPQQPPDQTVAPPSPPSEGAQPPQVKTPEQLLEELRNLQQQQQNPQQR